MTEVTVKTNLVGNGAIRVTIPKALCDPLDIKKGSSLVMIRVGKRIIVRKKAEP